jgi:hypothetical protein
MRMHMIYLHMKLRAGDVKSGLPKLADSMQQQTAAVCLQALMGPEIRC